MTTANPPLHASPPACGACGYDTTGLTSLTCPECGSDLRTAGIFRGRREAASFGFIVQAIVLLVPWVVCGFILGAAVTSLVPEREVLREDVRLSMPRSGAYQSINVVVTASGWVGRQPAVRVELQLTPLASGGAAPRPPAPLAVVPGVTDKALLNWLSGAGIDANDARVRAEAQAVVMAAVRGMRTRERYGGGNYSSTSVLTGGTGGPFGSVSTTAAAGRDSTSVPVALFAVAWFALLVGALLFLWRAIRPRAAA